MVAELKPAVSPFLLEGIIKRAQGKKYAEIARDMGYNPYTFADSLRESCMTETGFTSITGTTAWLINQRLINLSSIIEGHDLGPVAALSTINQIMLNNTIADPPNPTGRKEIQRIDRDFGNKKDRSPDIAAIGANNMPQLLVLVAAFYTDKTPARNQLTEVKVNSQEADDKVNNLGGPKRRAKAIYKLRTGVPDERSFLVHYRYELDTTTGAEKPDKLVGRVLTEQQAAFIKLDAEGYTQTEIPAILGIHPREYYIELNAALDALQISDYDPALQTQEEFNSARRITTANLMIESGEIDPMKIANQTYASPQDLIGAFQGFTALKVHTLDLVAQGRTLSSVLEEASTKSDRDGTILTKNSLEKRISIVRDKIKASTTTQAIMFYRAYQSLLRHPLL